MSKPQPSRLRKIGAYVAYWLLFALFMGIMETDGRHYFRKVLTIELISLPLKMLFVLLVTEVLQESYLFKKKTREFVIGYLVLIIAFSFELRFLENFIILEYFLTDWDKLPLLSTIPLLVDITKLQFAAAIPFSYKLFSHWNAEQRKSHMVEQEKMQAELTFLRNQFHPHFIFNTLNSLYSKVLSKSEESADLVLKISSLLRFSIYDINKEWISLEKEISYIQDYIALQRVRFDKRLDLSLVIEGNPANKTIEPFLIIPFIENSFKYCTGAEDEFCWITIHLTILEEGISLKIENSLSKLTNVSERDDKGVGLENVRRRLALLYPNQHVLKIVRNEDSFFVLLKINFHSHGQTV